MGEELKFSSGGEVKSEGLFICGDDGGNWIPIAPLGKGTIETFDPEFDADMYVPNYLTFYELPNVTIELKVSKRWIRKFRNSLYGWDAKGPLRRRNLWKAARLRGRRL